MTLAVKYKNTTKKQIKIILYTIIKITIILLKTNIVINVAVFFIQFDFKKETC